MIPGEQVVRMKYGPRGSPTPKASLTDTLARIRASLGTDLVVLGWYVALGERSGAQIRLDLRVQDAARGRDDCVGHRDRDRSRAARPGVADGIGAARQAGISADVLPT